MGAEWWEYTVTFEPDAPDVLTALEKHKQEILAITPDWEDIRISLRPGIFVLTSYPKTKEDLRALYVAWGERNIDEDLGPNWQVEDLADTFFDDIPRGQGFYDIEHKNGKPVAVKFCGYSCD